MTYIPNILIAELVSLNPQPDIKQVQDIIDSIKELRLLQRDV